MPRRVWLSIAALALLLLVANLWFQPNPRTLGANSFGQGPYGYGAAYLLLSELGFDVSRSFVAPEQLAADGVVWFVKPSFLSDRSNWFSWQAGDADAEIAALERWVESGGTAVVIGDSESAWGRLDFGLDEPGERALAKLSGEWLRQERVVRLRDLARFGEPEGPGFVRLRADGAPFTIERELGEGRLIGIADARFMYNPNLDEAEESLVIVDLVRVLGTPVFDEYWHGLRESPSLVRVLGPSRVGLLTLALGLGLFAVLGERRRWPMRRLLDGERLEPTLQTFVSSLGTLYAKSRDHARVFQVYRRGFLHRLRRRSHAMDERSERAILQRIAADRSLSSELRLWLLEGGEPSTRNELRRAVRALETYAEAME